MRRWVWPVVGLLVGLVAGRCWGWFGGGPYERADSAAGTAFLGALAGLLAGALADAIVKARRGRRGSPRRR